MARADPDGRAGPDRPSRKPHARPYARAHKTRKHARTRWRRAQTQTHTQGTRSTGAGLAAAALQGLGEAVDLGLDPAEARDAVLDSPPDFFLWILQEAVEMLL